MIGIMTEDFALYHDLVQFLRQARVESLTLSPRRGIPKRISVILTSEEEAPRIRFPLVVAVRSLQGSVVLARRLDRGRRGIGDLVIGIDPGERIGFAVISGGEVILSGTAHRAEEVVEIVTVVAAAGGSGLVVKIGHGAPTKRNRIISLMRPLGIEPIVVDESLTSKRSRRGRDEDAAAHIASLQGAPLAGPLSLEPTLGEIRDIQRKSRIASRGLMTIDRETARRVGAGEISLEEAVASVRSKPERRSRPRGGVDGEGTTQP